MPSNEGALISPEQYPYYPESVRDSTLFALNCQPSSPVKMAGSPFHPFGFFPASLGRVFLLGLSPTSNSPLPDLCYIGLSVAAIFI